MNRDRIIEGGGLLGWMLVCAAAILFVLTMPTRFMDASTRLKTEALGGVGLREAGYYYRQDIRPVAWMLLVAGFTCFIGSALIRKTSKRQSVHRKQDESGGIRGLYVLLVLALCMCAIPFRAQLQRPVVAVIQSMKGKKTVSDRVSQYGDAVRARLGPQFAGAKVAYPPRRVTLVGLKAERTIQVWVSGDDGKWTHLRDYPILGMSGVLGPKLKEGDRQVPEGLYGVESLNPNSLYHLALRVNYPNAQDRLRGKKDGRSELGSDIMIHGKTCSIGCLAMGDEAAEDLFVLAAETGIENVSVILAPVDFRTRELPESMPATPPWAGELYDSIKEELRKL